MRPSTEVGADGVKDEMATSYMRVGRASVVKGFPRSFLVE